MNKRNALPSTRMFDEALRVPTPLGQPIGCLSPLRSGCITTEVIRVTLVGQSDSVVRRTIQAKGHQNDSGPTFPLAKTGAISTSRIRRRRAQDVADTTDSLRAVACIRFVERVRCAQALRGGRCLRGWEGGCHAIVACSCSEWLEHDSPMKKHQLFLLPSSLSLPPVPLI